MPNIWKILRSITPGNRPPGRSYGEMYVNFGDNQLGVFDSSNVARDLIGVPVFSSSHAYSAGNAVVYQGGFYIALGAVAAGPWTAAQWVQISGAAKTLSMKFTPFTASGTYTPSPGLVSAILETIAGGGGGGGTILNASLWSNGAGGGSGGYSRALRTAAQIGASQPITIGAGGTAGVGATNGGNGGDTSIGTLCVAHGGRGGGHVDVTGPVVPTGGAGGVPGTGDIVAAGNAGEGCQFVQQAVGTAGAFGRGGPSPLGGGPAAYGPWPAGGVGGGNGPAGQAYGAGGSGGMTAGGGTAGNGGVGAPGAAFITEFIFA